MTDSIYRPIEIPDFLLKAISTHKQSHFINDNRWTYLYIGIWLACLLMFGIGFLFEIKILFIIGLLLLVFKVIFNLLYKYSNRYYWRTISFVKKELKQRHVLSQEDLLRIWKTKKRLDIANRINSICIEEIGWNKNSIFLPEDSFNLMINFYAGILDEVCCITVIEEAFAVDLPNEYFIENQPGDLKFKDVVDHVIKNKGE